MDLAAVELAAVDLAAVELAAVELAAVELAARPARKVGSSSVPAAKTSRPMTMSASRWAHQSR